ncbi:MAG: parallel beta-helix repeat-containing protein [Rhodospirillaceae bacterium]|nr:MAG: parallel beta-helix repeat-containing protein [Rhodospirillaceae bacterium]
MPRADEPASLLISARDTSRIVTTISTEDSLLTALTGFDVAVSDITLSRDTRAFIGEGGSVVTIAGQNGGRAGMVTVAAENNGTIEGRIESSLIGVHGTTATRDDVLAGVNGAVLTVGALQVSALNASVYTAVAKVAGNTVTRRTEASLEKVTVTALPATATQGVTVLARDESTFSATSKDFQANLGMFPSVELGKAAASNEIHKSVLAMVENSTLTVTGGTVQVAAVNDMSISAETEALATINTIGGAGWKTTYSLSLGGTAAWNEVLGSVTARMRDTTVTTAGTAEGTGGDVIVSAANTSAIHSKAEAGTTVTGGTNAAVGVAVAFNAIGWDMSGFLAASLDALIGSGLGMTETPSDVEALIERSAVDAGGALTVTADGHAAINATVSNTVESIASALYGASGMGAAGLVASNRVRSTARASLKDAESGGMSVRAGGALTVAATDTAGIYANIKLVSSSTTTNDGGAGILSDAAAWIGSDHKSSDGTKTISFDDLIWLEDDYENGGDGGQMYRYLGTGATMDLGGTDYTDADYWQKSLTTSPFPTGINLTDSDSVAIGGLVVRNDVRSAVEAFISDVTVDAGSVSVTAEETATITATADSTVSSSGGSAFGTGTSLAVNGTIATNLVLSSAEALITGSSVHTSGDTTVAASNASTITATTKSMVSSGADAIGATLAFNTIGWKAQNILFQAIDALLGTSIGDEQPAAVTASIVDSALAVGGPP